MLEFLTYLSDAFSVILMLVGAAFVLFLMVLFLLYLRGHIAFISYVDEDEEDANT